MNNKLKVLAGSLVLVLGFVAVNVSAQTDLDANAVSGGAKVEVTSTVEGAILKVGTENTVTWKTENFPGTGFVHINLIKKVSDSPAKYQLVRQISSYAVNDGEETWIPERGDVGENISIEVTCAGSARFAEGCVSGQGNNSFAIESSFGTNLAGVLGAFFDKFLGIFIN